MRMKVTQYGYADDPYMDSETKKGNGAYHKLEKGVSCALTGSAKAALKAQRLSWIKITFADGRSQVRRVDDHAPQGEKRVDLYNPDGFDKTLADFADVTLTKAP